MRQLAALAICIPLLGGCGGGSALQQAQEQVAASSAAVTIAATSATAAHHNGLIKPGPVETDINAGLHGAQAALDNADAQLKAGSAGGAVFYANQIGTLLGEVWKDMTSVGVQQPTGAAP